MQVWERGNGKLCVNTIVDCIYCSLWSKEIAHPNNCLFSFLGKENRGCLGQMWQHWIFPKHTHTHTHTHVHTDCSSSSIMELRCLSEVRLFPVIRNDCWHSTAWQAQITTRSTIMRTTTTRITTHSTMTSFLSKERTIDQDKAHKSTDHPVSLAFTFPSHRFEKIWWIAKIFILNQMKCWYLKQCYSNRCFVYVVLADMCSMWKPVSAQN